MISIYGKTSINNYKKYLIILTLLLSVTGSVYGQKTDFGAKAGLLTSYAKVKDDVSSASGSDSGFFIGVFGKFSLGEKFALIPEANYGNISDTSFGFLSTVVSYEFVKKLNLQLGPQVSYILESTPDDVSKLGVDLSSGLAYDINQNFSLNARYNYELTNRARNVMEEDITARFNWLMIGVSYIF